MAKRLRQQFPDLTIMVGLWTFTLSERAAERFGQAFVETVVTTLGDAVNQVQRLADASSPEDSPGGDDAVARATPAALG
jgi:3-deoxy-D-manno-octulosonic-acid transferase